MTITKRFILKFTTKVLDKDEENELLEYLRSFAEMSVPEWLDYKYGDIKDIEAHSEDSKDV